MANIWLVYDFLLSSYNSKKKVLSFCQLLFYFYKIKNLTFYDSCNIFREVTYLCLGDTTHFPLLVYFDKLNLTLLQF